MAIYLNQKGVEKKDFNSYGARRGNHEVMMRGTFANVRIKNEMLGGVKEGGFTKNDRGEIVSIYDSAIDYKNKNIQGRIDSLSDTQKSVDHFWDKYIGINNLHPDIVQRIKNRLNQ